MPDAVPDPQATKVGYVLKRYPRFSETFIVSEILAHEAAGQPIEIFALRGVEEPHFQDMLGRVRAPVTRIPDKLKNADALWTLMRDACAALRDAAHAVEAPPFRGEIAFEGVGFSYGAADAPALGAITLRIAPGERIAITGPSGSGKSTFASLILRLYDPTEGRILIDGADIRGFTLKSLRAQIGLVPQETLLFRASLGENLALGAGRAVTEAEIAAAARLANAHDFIMALPQGYATELAERGATLSAGQRQRIAIARAALRQSPILILDEPTVGLDGANEAEVTGALWRLAEGRTSLLITHDVQLAARADRILYIDRGGLAEDGGHAALMALGGRYAALWRLQAGRAAQTGRKPYAAAG